MLHPDSLLVSDRVSEWVSQVVGKGEGELGGYTLDR